MTLSLPWPFPHSDGNNPIPLPRKRSLSFLLRQYETPGVYPTSARVDPTLKRRENVPLRLWDVWKYGAFVATKATTIAGDVVSHSIWGPRKKSWGIQMTIISSFMRDAGRHSSLVDITTIRLLMSIGGLVPLPSDALVTPVTFRVRKRNLRGILADFDAKETGSRELSGEWVVGKKLWQRLQAEWKASRDTKERSNPITMLKPATKQIRQKERVILYLHGGAYYLSSAAAQRLISIPLSKYTDARVFALDYRLAPETQFPGPLHDAVSGYLRLVEDLCIPPENIIVAGDSAGGGLSIALLMYLRDNGYPLPSGGIVMSPWVDLTMSCDSWDSNAQFDVVPMPAPDDHLNPVGLYLGDDIARYVTHPYVSPLFGNFKGLPPLLIQAGDAEVLRDEITLLAHKASLAGVEVRHELYEDAIHVFQSFPFVDATHRAFMSCRDFVRNTLPNLEGRSPQLLDGTAEAKLEHEIDNEKARVVRGDGVEASSGVQKAKIEMEEIDEIDGDESGSDTETEDEEDVDRSSQNDYPSWGRTRTRSRLPSLISTDDVDLDWAEGNAPPAEPCTPRAPPRQDGPNIPGMRRIQSALSILSQSPVPPPTVRRHQRGPSNANTSSVSSRRRSLSHRTAPLGLGVSLPKLGMSSVTFPVPSPSIRRSSTSHPDITLLVQQWANNGPANQTMMYKPHTYSNTP